MKYPKHRIVQCTLLIIIAALLIALPYKTALADDDVQSSVYPIDRTKNIMQDIAVGTSVSQLKTNLENDASTIKICLKDGSEYTENAVATGMSVQLTSNGVVIDTLQLVVCGDANGDGSISISDYTLARLHILALKPLQNEYKDAGDVNQDGQISITDYTLMRLHILGLKHIVPGSSDLPLSGYTIGLDPGHQGQSNKELELVSPNGTDQKKKVSSGTQGRFTNVPEYVINLQVGLKLKAKLESLGAVVIMTRETHDVNISNAQRAVMMNDANVDCWLRIHADGSNNPSVNGISILVPTSGSMNTDDASVAEKSTQLANALLTNVVSKTSAKNNGLASRDDQTGFCWSARPVCNIEMGYMTNEVEDRLLVTDAYQTKIVDGLAQGFVQYFSE